MIYSSSGEQVSPKPKKTTQGQGSNSRPKHNKKLSRGQGN